MKRRTLLACIICVALAATFSSAEPVPRDGVFIHISSGPDQAHRVLMALNMANMMAEEHDVLIYFDIDAIHVVLADAPDIMYAHFPSSHAALDQLLAAEVTLMVCPGCLKAAGKSLEDVRSGIRPADRKAFFSFTKGRILTLDY